MNRYDDFCVPNNVKINLKISNPQSVKEQNFRYMGARLFQLLDSLDEGQDSVLWRLMRMKLEHQESELVSFMQNEQVRVRGTTLFLAELYMQLRKPQVRGVGT